MIPPEHIQRTAPSSASSFTSWRISKYTLLAQLYFFFNSVLLPKGLLYTHLLGPLFYWNALKAGTKTYAGVFFTGLLVYDCIHLLIGVSLKSFITSNALLVLTYFSVAGIAHFIRNYRHLGRIMRDVLLLNFVLVLIAIPFFFQPREWQSYFWYINKLTKGVTEFPRLALFTYEASYYSLLLVPVVFYYTLKLVTRQQLSNRWLTAVMVIAPMLLSLSFGVLGAALLTAIILFLVYRKRLLRYQRTFFVLSGLLLALAATLVALYWWFPGNPVFIRLSNILEGNDTSARGRTIESFTMAWRVADSRSLYFGAGLGQIKEVNVELVRKYYNYWGYLPRYDIPNAMGETLAIFGLSGVALRLALQLWLFRRLCVWRNYYCLSLFVFMFIYQFTGSFITNTVEYVIWILAFSPVFPAFAIVRQPPPAEDFGRADPDNS